MRQKNKIYLADKVSGLHGDIFALSVVGQIILAYNSRWNFKLPFYALIFDPKKRHATEYIDELEYKKQTHKLLLWSQKRNFKNFKHAKYQCSKEAEDFRKYSLQLPAQIPAMADPELIKAFSRFISKYSYHFSLGVITFLCENVLSQELGAALAERYENPAEIISVLLKSKYRSFILKGESEFIRVSKTKNRTLQAKALHKAYKKYFYLNDSYFYQKRLSAKALLKKFSSIEPNNPPSKNTETSYELKPREASIVKILQYADVIHDQRKKINYIGNHVLYSFIDEAAKRRRFNPILANRCFWFEYPQLLLKTKEILNTLKKRNQATLLWDAKTIRYSDQILVKAKANLNLNKTILKGTPASPGSAQGIAKIIFRQDDFKKMKKGNILVAQMTRPEFLPIMKLAGAIVTDEGGITSHAAIISRELGIPCVVGLKSATDVLKDGDKVKVNANQGAVEKLN